MLAAIASSGPDTSSIGATMTGNLSEFFRSVSVIGRIS
jgi:hypothetical protein